MPRVRRGVLTDWYRDGDQSAVLVDGQVLVLSELATTVIDVVGEEGCALSVLVDSLADRFGDPAVGTAGGSTARAVDTLALAGVLVLEPG